MRRSKCFGGVIGDDKLKEVCRVRNAESFRDKSILNSVQCSGPRMGVVWSHFLDLVTKQTSAVCTSSRPFRGSVVVVVWYSSVEE